MSAKNNLPSDTRDTIHDIEANERAAYRLHRLDMKREFSQNQ